MIIESERIIESQELILVERKRVLYSIHIKLYFQIDLKCEKQEIYTLRTDKSVECFLDLELSVYIQYLFRILQFCFTQVINMYI